MEATPNPNDKALSMLIIGCPKPTAAATKYPEVWFKNNPSDNGMRDETIPIKTVGRDKKSKVLRIFPLRIMSRLFWTFDDKRPIFITPFLLSIITFNEEL